MAEKNPQHEMNELTSKKDLIHLNANQIQVHQSPLARVSNQHRQLTFTNNIDPGLHREINQQQFLEEL